MSLASSKLGLYATLTSLAFDSRRVQGDVAGDVAGNVAGLRAFLVTSRRLTSRLKSVGVRLSAFRSPTKPD